MLRSKLALTLALIGAVVAISPASGADAVPKYVTDAMGWWERPPLEFRHDVALKTADIVTFAGVKPGQKVTNIFPGSGYYTRIFSRIVGKDGMVYAVVPRAAGKEGPKVKEFGFGIQNAAAELNRVERLTAGRGTVDTQGNLANVRISWSNIDGQQYPTDPRYNKLPYPEMLDVVFMAYGYHVLRGEEFSKVDIVDFNRVLYRNLNNGGTVVIVDNAAAKGADPKVSTALGRVDPELVKADMLAAGFVLDGESTVLARADDDRNQLAVDVIQTRDGRPSDGFVLKFKKPTNAPNTNKRPANYAKALAGVFGNTIVSGYSPDAPPRDQRLHLMHKDGTYQEISKTSFDSGQWFYNVDGWNCRYRLGIKFADCHNYPGEYENRRVGDKWNNAAQREAWRATELGAQQVMTPGDDYVVLKGHDYNLVMGQ